MIFIDLEKHQFWWSPSVSIIRPHLRFYIWNLAPWSFKPRGEVLLLSVLFMAAAVVHAVLLTVLHALLRILKLSYDQYLINVVKHEFNLQRAVMAYNTLSAMQYELCKVPSPEMLWQ